ncbi:hypothetical protein [Helicobacter cetorum]|uniref:hypothetical protein n=1 Tax=Helicobacter cetorum TaxID=138563 RepID=UPI000CF115C8|nr:hypothetical protein [Helicobacter cetorum]
MDTPRFIRNFITFKQALEKQNFTNKELNSISMQGALQCEQLSLQENEQNLANEQARAKMQLEFLSMQAQLQASKASTLNTLIQCQSMLKSLKDNAMINRANAYVSLLQVQANAPSGVTPENFKNVLNTIMQIGREYDNPSVGSDKNLSFSESQAKNELKSILEELSNELEKLNAENNLNQIQVFSDKLEVLVNAPVKLWGFSTLNQANEGFYNEQDELIASGGVCLFRSESVGKHTITFKAENEKESLVKKITISVVDNALNR